ncbi:ABC transporter permease [Lacihabitans sp. LS3-19]|uniref:ABC transporter permease n=1 Tax=Lacihabitans sp. LS3-19 TaxID=2487335 RepID=UPI0020CC5176|nr:FtsX-like permease family protein [Lacihabitans sp. LS3-19]MCP9770878.1 ABC transporter permease [Lacihabitans sp. LS3-19]
MLLKIAWRNIWRNRSRSLIIIIAIILGLWAGVFITGFSWGMYETRIQKLITGELSHLQMHNEKFNEEILAKHILPDKNKYLDVLKHDKNVNSFSERLVVNAMMASSRSSLGIKLSGVDPEQEKLTTRLNEKLKSGEYLDISAKTPILISQKTAEKLKLGLRKKLVLTFQDKNGEIVSASFRIAGIFRSGNLQYDEANAFVRKSDLDTLLKTQGEIQEIAVLLNSDKDLAEVQEKLKAISPKVSVQNWREMDPLMEYAIDSFDQTMQILIFIIMIALAFGIINTMLMAIMDRVREIGMLMAIGLNKTKLFTMIMLETLMLSAIGAPLGMFLAWLTIFITHKTGIELKSMETGLEAMGFSSTVYPVAQSDQYWKIGIMVLVISVFSAIFPVYKAIKLDPAKAIRKI